MYVRLNDSYIIFPFGPNQQLSVTLVAQQLQRDTQLCNQHVCCSLVSGWSRFCHFFCQRSCVCVRLHLKTSLLSTMWPRLMLCMLFACVPLNHVGVVSPAAAWWVPKTHSGLGPQRPLEASAEQEGMEPLGPRHSDVPQLFPPLQPLQPLQLPWTYPEPPVEPESEVQEEFQPGRAAMVPKLGLRCGEKKVAIEVKQDFWGNGKLIHPAELTLGECPHVEHDDRARVIIFESELQDCGSERLVWTFLVCLCVYYSISARL